MNVLTRMADGLVNLVSGLGTPRDKASGATYTYDPPLQDAELVNFYRSSWLARKIVQVPAHDAFRKWRNWQAQPDQITALEAEEKRLGLRDKLAEAYWKARLFGGAAVYISDGAADTSKPLDVGRIGKGGIKFLNVMLPKDFEFSQHSLERDPQSPNFNRPSLYRFQTGKGGVNTFGLDIHPSRLVVFTGDELPDPDLAIGAGGYRWGESVLQGQQTAIKNAEAVAANVVSLIYEAKVDVINVPNLMSSLSDPAYEARILKRFQLAAMGKGINGTLLLDGEETYSHKSASFSTLDSLLDKFNQIVAGASDIPVTRLLGNSPGGLNSTGEGDQRNYYDHIQSIQETEITPAISTLDEVLIRSALGGRDPDIHYVWASLWQTSDKERAEVGKAGAEIISKLNDTGLYPREALASAGANFMVEHSILPGFDKAIGEGGDNKPDYDLGNPDVTTDAAPRTLYVRRDVLNGEEIIAWAKEQGFKTTLPADDLHVTIAYSRQPLDWMKLGEAWTDEIKVVAGGPRMMEAFGKNGEAKVLLFNCSILSWRHEEIKNAGGSWDHPEYQPHITISYSEDAPDIAAIEPYRGVIQLGPEIFEDINEDWASGIKES